MIKPILPYLQRNKENVILIFLILLSFFLRFIYINFNPVGWDEPFSIFHAQMRISEIVENLKGGNNPPLYEIILHLWIKLFGINPISVRFPSLIFSVINVIFTFIIARKIFNLQISTLATILILLSSYHIYFSHEARVYSLFALLTTISFYLIILLMTENRSINTFIWLFLTYVILVFSHYIGVFVVLFQAFLVIVFRYKEKDILKKYFIVFAGLILSFSFYIPEFFSRFSNNVESGTWLKPVENLGNLHDIVFLFANEHKFYYLVSIVLFWGASWKLVLKMDLNTKIKTIFLFVIIPIFFLTSYSIFFKIPFIWRLTSLKIYSIFFLLTIICFYLFYIVKNRNKDRSKQIIAIWFVIPLLIFFSASFFFPIFLNRYLVFILPAFYLLIALCINYLFKNTGFYIVSILLVVFMVFSIDLKGNQNLGIDKTVQQIKDLKDNSTKLIICPEQFKLTFLYHYDQESFSDYNDIIGNLNQENIYPLNTINALESVIDTSDSKIIFLDAHSNFLYPNNGLLNTLTKSFELVNRYEYKDSIVVYQLKKQAY